MRRRIALDQRARLAPGRRSAAWTAAARTSTSARSPGTWRPADTRSTSSPAATATDLPAVVHVADGVRVVHVAGRPADAGPQGGAAPLHGRVHRLRAAIPAGATQIRPGPCEFLHVGLVAAELKRALGIPVRRDLPRPGPGPPAPPGRGRRVPRGAAGHRGPGRRRGRPDHRRVPAGRGGPDPPLRRRSRADRDHPLRLRPAEFWPVDKRGRPGDAGPRPGRAARSSSSAGWSRARASTTSIRGLARLRKRARRSPRGCSSSAASPTTPTRRSRRRSAGSRRSPREEGVADAVTLRGQPGPAIELRYYYSAADVFVTDPLVRAVRHHAGGGDGLRHAGRRLGRRRHQVHGPRRRDRLPRPARATPTRSPSGSPHLYSESQARRPCFGRRAIRRANDLFTWQRVTGTWPSSTRKCYGPSASGSSAGTTGIPRVVGSRQPRPPRWAVVHTVSRS